ncbi:MAG: Lrp/AsnC family transcriptional regulator [Proteobacteria bacterium]|nr:Lrp/AsnC family transcriptional regulator [Pseudomonadota bacterium]
MLTKTETKIAKYIQGDIPLVQRPFKRIGEEVGIGEEKVTEAINDLIKRGTIRKFGAVIRHQKAGFTQNAMVVWAVPDERCEAVGKTFASFKEITHCYERTPPFEEKYNIFTMIHFKENDQEKLLQKLSSVTGIKDFKVLISEEEFKKSSMEYF